MSQRSGKRVKRCQYIGCMLNNLAKESKSRFSEKFAKLYEFNFISTEYEYFNTTSSTLLINSY